MVLVIFSVGAAIASVVFTGYAVQGEVKGVQGDIFNMMENNTGPGIGEVGGPSGNVGSSKVADALAGSGTAEI